MHDQPQFSIRRTYKTHLLTMLYHECEHQTCRHRWEHLDQGKSYGNGTLKGKPAYIHDTSIRTRSVRLADTYFREGKGETRMRACARTHTHTHVHIQTHTARGICFLGEGKRQKSEKGREERVHEGKKSKRHTNREGERGERERDTGRGGEHTSPIVPEHTPTSSGPPSNNLAMQTVPMKNQASKTIYWFT